MKERKSENVHSGENRNGRLSPSFADFSFGSSERPKDVPNEQRLDVRVVHEVHGCTGAWTRPDMGQVLGRVLGGEELASG